MGKHAFIDQRATGKRTGFYLDLGAALEPGGFRQLIKARTVMTGLEGIYDLICYLLRSQFTHQEVGYSPCTAQRTPHLANMNEHVAGKQRPDYRARTGLFVEESRVIIVKRLPAQVGCGYGLVVWFRQGDDPRHYY
jgi:hypothetical protein